ncbi:response regulator [Criblamydia sequanensis]|uniref:Signal transduction response regulator n=1 Tax=Candidatus Criblamydia sequanensis CRIB-18 TaxID=1437425 RepID=A0A090D249_9BACT|nr:response regulator [Criblamydia sequanensis]CDR34315.1 Signal transduction response regulator [Criblamydia sequanensis CRIB-18]
MIKKITTKFDASILVVEDYSLNAEVVKEMLEMMGCSVDIAENGKVALDLLQNYDYDLIFMDIQMPVTDGVAATQMIRDMKSEKKDIPIIALTANAFPGDREKYLASGMNGFISKPLRAQDLEAILLKYLPKKED